MGVLALCWRMLGGGACPPLHHYPHKSYPKFWSRSRKNIMRTPEKYALKKKMSGVLEINYLVLTLGAIHK